MRRHRSSSAKYRKGQDAKYADRLTNDDEDDDIGIFADELKTYNANKACSELNIHRSSEKSEKELAVAMTGPSVEFTKGDPFSAIIKSMWPQDLVSKIVNRRKDAKLTNGEKDNSLFETRESYDEFGYKIDVEGGPEAIVSKFLSTTFTEDPRHRLNWIAHLEFTHSRVVGELTWDKVNPLLTKCDELYSLIREKGVPHSLRPYIWPRLCGAVSARKKAAFEYKDLLKAANKDRPSVAKQIEKDLLRTMPTNACFADFESVGVPRMRRILRAIAYLYPDIGYCQGMGVIIGTLLLFVEEEETFWLMITIIEDILPASYFTQSLIGVQADQKVFRQLISTFLPDIDRLLKEHDIELSLISLNWFLTLFSSVLHVRIVLRIWDLFFYEGSVALFKVALGMLKLKESEFESLTNSADIFNLLSNLPSTIDDADSLIEATDQIGASKLTEAQIVSKRKKHLAYLMADQGLMVGDPKSIADINLPKQKISRRRLKRSQSLVSHIFRDRNRKSSDESHSFGYWSYGGEMGEEENDAKLKNVRQTELMVDLKQAILKISRHFILTDPNGHRKVNLQADYTLESHASDHENYLAVQKKRRKRARALLDFERRDDDELGFRRNDILTILSMRDEHCWIGELNGMRGWFPAKFVELLDERSKEYSALGDDSVNEIVTDLVRGNLCSALKVVFEHGMKKQSVLAGPCHPWIFIEDVANEEVKRDFQSVYSRLILCKTFRLDEDGKVLTPDELLYKSVQQINTSHNLHKVQMDVKFRSLICLGLNEQVLHLWWELLCSNQRLVEKYYQPWSFVRSPGWVQIKCELRLLTQFAFRLSVDWELPFKACKGVEQPLKEGVRDMLVKHHLFSWDL